MLKTLHKSILITLLLILSCSQIVHAERKLYQNDGNMPFVDMMLSMMSVMGMIDRVPGNGRYGGYGASGLSNPYARALAMQGMSPGLLNSGFGNNPLMTSPWLQTPWSSSSLNNSNINNASPLWGTPSWGVLPLDNFAPKYYSMYNPYGSSSPWSTSELDGWVNETWETSLWNPGAGVKAEAPVQTRSPQWVQPSVPLVQNFNYITPPKPARKMQQHTGQRTSKQSPLSKLAPSNRPPAKQQVQLAPSNRPPARQQAQQSARAPVAQQRKQSPLHKNNGQNIREKPCVTDFCGLKKPNLNGLWVAENGEMLGVKNKRYLWADSNERYLSGQILIQNEYLLTSVDGHEKTMRFKYKLAGNHLLTMRPDGTIREFVRVPVRRTGNQY